jgi:hypothetical protein
MAALYLMRPAASYTTPWDTIELKSETVSLPPEHVDWEGILYWVFCQFPRTSNASERSDRAIPLD